MSKDTHCYILTVLFDMVANLNINAFQSPLALNKYNLAPWKIHSKMICYRKNLEETERKENFLFSGRKNIFLLVGYGNTIIVNRFISFHMSFTFFYYNCESVVLYTFIVPKLLHKSHSTATFVAHTSA